MPSAVEVACLHGFWVIEPMHLCFQNHFISVSCHLLSMYAYVFYFIFSYLHRLSYAKKNVETIFSYFYINPSRLKRTFRIDENI